MRTVIIGDKSRYFFLRSVLKVECSEMDELRTERLMNQNILVTSDRNVAQKEKCFFSKKIPLQTELLFVNDFDQNNPSEKENNRVIVFDESPFRTTEEITRLKKYVFSERGGLEIALVDNGIGSYSDISNMEQAIRNTETEYQKEGFFVRVLQKGAEENILYYPIETEKENVLPEKMIHRMQERLADIESQVDLYYMLYDENQLVSEDDASGMAERLMELMKYDKGMNQKPASAILEKKVSEFYWKNEKSQYFNLTSRVYKKVVSYVFSGPCVWNIDADVANLYKDIRISFLRAVSFSRPLDPVPDYFQYENFKANHREELDEFRNAIINYLQKGIKSFLCNRVNSRFEKLFSLMEVS